MALGRRDREALVVALRRDGVGLLLLLLLLPALLLLLLLLLLLQGGGEVLCPGGERAAAEAAELGGTATLGARVDAPG